MKTQRDLAAAISPSLALAVPFLVFASHNGYPWARPALWLACATVMLPGLLLGALSQLGDFRVRVGALGVATALAVDLQLRSSSSVVKGEVAVAAIVVIVGLAAALRDRLFPPVAVFLGIFLLTTPLARVGDPLVAERGGTATPSPRLDLPPIVYLILDEQGGVDAIPEEADPGGRLRTTLREAYVENGFRVYTRAYSRYFNSYNSIPNVLNLSSAPNDNAYLRRDGNDESRILLENEAFRRLAQRGYRIRVYQSSYMDFTQSKDAPVDYAYTYQIHSVGMLADLPMPVPQKTVLLLNSFTEKSVVIGALRDGYASLRKAGGRSGVHLPAWPRNPGGVAVPAAAALQRLAGDLATRENRGTLTFAHITLPHYSYLFDDHCRPQPSLEDWRDRRVHKGRVEESDRRLRYEAYVQQSLCGQTLVTQLIEGLRAKGDWDDAVVIVHGDHGSRITAREPSGRNATKLTDQDQRDSFATFLAIKRPGVPAGISEVPVAVQDALAIVLDGREPEIAPPYVLLRATGKFREVPFTGYDSTR